MPKHRLMLFAGLLFILAGAVTIFSRGGSGAAFIAIGAAFIAISASQAKNDGGDA